MALLAGWRSLASGQKPAPLHGSSRRTALGKKTRFREEHGSCQGFQHPDVRNPEEAMPQQALTIYSTTWCGYCRRLKFLLAEAGIDFNEVDIEATPSAAEAVEKVTGGMRTVPTVVMPDGTALVNPPMYDIVHHLDQASS
jgi:mycoredoxin